MCVTFEVIPAELTMRPVRLAHLHARVLGDPAGIPVTLINYTIDAFGHHFDALRILGADPLLQEVKAKRIQMS